ncbi:DnaB-like helicase C-terminal domain-containing protein [Pseudochrobactrum sp. XF203]|uniref:replicative DNA helicase n=1 Tax=Pseudochrobactrum sp. XF203 TaxID=2879116 RepID=UPI001CE250B7|nr:DnaB-like helicase C-terminal domain-containing protein [Pseudochrobactrum sp. XF203]UCA47040.1 AAA family ATPase [Pseudochrobactrum sp. XF203]
MTLALNQSDFVVEIEQEVLGSLMLGGFGRVASMLEARHFIEPVHQHIYQAIASAHERFNSARPDIVVKLLPEPVREAHEQSTGLGISNYLARMATSSVLGSANIEKSAKQVIEQAARLALADQAESLSTAARDPNSNPAELVTKAGVIFDDIVSDLRRGSKRKSQVSVSHAASNAIIAAEIAMATGTGITGLSWGLSDINHVTGGIHKRDLTLIGARPSMGKTSVAMSVACKLAKQGHGVGFISLEMDAEKLAARAVSDLAYDDNIRIPYQDLVTGRLSQPDLYALKRVQKEMDGLPLLIEEQSGLSISDIRVKLEVMLEASEKAGHALDCLMIDHLGLIRASNRYSGNRTNEIAEMTGALKSMAREYDISVVLLSQLNRAVEQQADKRPQLSALRDSGAIEQDADTIIFLYREAYYLEREKHDDVDKEIARQDRLAEVKNKLEFHIAKQRNGPVTQVDLFIDVACSAVRNAARYEA